MRYCYLIACHLIVLNLLLIYTLKTTMRHYSYLIDKKSSETFGNLSRQPEACSEAATVISAAPTVNVNEAKPLHLPCMLFAMLEEPVAHFLTFAVSMYPDPSFFIRAHT